MFNLICDRNIRINQFYASNTPWLTHIPQLKLVNKFGNLNSIITALIKESMTEERSGQVLQSASRT